jgi:cytochrome c-type biogenesis protein CcmE
MNRTRIAVVGGIAVVVGVFAWLLWGGIDSNIVYFLTPSELMAKGTGGYDAPVRIGGMVQDGSVQWDKDRLELRFNVTDGQTVIPVFSKGAPPQMFQAGIGVVLEGKYQRSGVFHSNTLMVKHSNEYKPPADGEMPAEMYKALTRGSQS